MKYFATLFIFWFLSACSQIPSSLENNTELNVKTGQTTSSNEVSYYDKPLSNNINDYAKWLVQDLFASIDLPSNDETFMVADLAILDSDLNETNLFGRQMSEAILHEVHQTGFSTLDIKSTGFVRVSENGGIFIESRDYADLQQTIDATNAITGTLTKYRGGYLLNARAVTLSNNVVIASAQIFVPFSVVDSVIAEGKTEAQNVQAEIEQVKEFVAQVKADLSSQKTNQPNPTNAGIPLKKYTAKD
jgi:hypothetical protein